MKTLHIKTVLLLGILAMLAFGPACGVKKAPLPAGLLLPDRPNSVSYTFTESGNIAVSFRRPRKNMLGNELNDLGGFYVDRSENLAKPSFCEGCPVQYTSRIEVAAKPPPPGKTLSDRPYSFQDTLRVGYVYKYRIYAHTKSGEYDPSRFATLVVHYGLPAMAPESIRVEVEDRTVLLTWAPSNRSTEGVLVEDLAGYEIYRKAKGGDWENLTASGLWGHAQYEDNRVANRTVYDYRIRAVRNLRGTLIAGPFSPVVEAVPLDLTPPPPPVRVDAVSAQNGIRLYWPEVTVGNPAGYRVYRRERGKTRFEHIGPALIREYVYLDATARPGGDYSYAVTTVDSSPEANESGLSPETWIVHEP